MQLSESNVPLNDSHPFLLHNFLSFSPLKPSQASLPSLGRVGCGLLPIFKLNKISKLFLFPDPDLDSGPIFLHVRLAGRHISATATPILKHNPDNGQETLAKDAFRAIFVIVLPVAP